MMLYNFQISVTYIYQFLNFVKRGADNRPYRIWSFSFKIGSLRQKYFNNMYVYNVHIPAMTHSVIASLTALQLAILYGSEAIPCIQVSPTSCLMTGKLSLILFTSAKYSSNVDPFILAFGNSFLSISQLLKISCKYSDPIYNSQHHSMSNILQFKKNPGYVSDLFHHEF